MKPVYIILLIGALLIPGCGKDKVKPSEDYLLSQKVYESMNTIKDAYLSKSSSTLKNRVEDSLSESIINAMTFKKAELTINQKLIRITDDTVKVSTSWQGTWWLSGDREFQNRGIADLIFQRDTLKLSDITGDNPFILPEMKN
jgi:hypothetical protein